MINHVVLFKLKEFSQKEKIEVIANLKKKLLALQDLIPELKHIEVGENYELDSKSYDLALLSHFNSVEDLDKYRVHPEHLKVGKLLGETTNERAAVDFNF